MNHYRKQLDNIVINIRSMKLINISCKENVSTSDKICTINNVVD